MATIFCDNDGCMFSDGCGFCDCDKLSIVDGVCEGSYGRNASDDDERLKAENAKLRELLQKNYYIVMSERAALDTQDINPDDAVYKTALDKEIDKMKAAMLELGIKVDE